MKTGVITGRLVVRTKKNQDELNGPNGNNVHNDNYKSEKLKERKNPALNKTQPI